MKTYDERMDAILKKARKQRIVRVCLKSVASVLCFVAIIAGVFYIPYGSANVGIASTTPSTNPTKPTNTHVDINTVPTVTEGPTFSTMIKQEIDLIPSLTMAMFGDRDLRYSYYLDKECSYGGDVVTAVVRVQNLGSTFEFCGLPTDQLGTVAYLRAENADYSIASDVKPLSDIPVSWNFVPGDVIEVKYSFFIPQDVIADRYYLSIAAFGTEISFDVVSVTENPDLNFLGDLSEEEQRKILGDEEYNSTRYQRMKYTMPVYGMFRGVYVFLYYTDYGNWLPQYEIVNGLSFEIRYGANIMVYTAEGSLCSLSDAYASGVLTDDQLEQVYKNYQIGGVRLADYANELIVALFGDLNSWYNKALTSEYDTPAQLVLSQFFLNAFREEGNEVADFERAQLKDLYGFGDYIDMVGITRLPVDRMNQVLQAYFGITLDEIDVAADNDLHYLESTDCYYIVGGGASGAMDFKASSFEILQDGSICVYYTANWEETLYAVTLMPTDDDYRILSNVKVE